MLMKTYQVTKWIPLGTFKFEGSERVVMCFFPFLGQYCVFTYAEPKLWHIESRTLSPNRSNS